MKNSAILLVSCPDAKGEVATIADFVYRHNGNLRGRPCTSGKRKSAQ
jgi:formyltetrahydrofolate hydrolase